MDPFRVRASSLLSTITLTRNRTYETQINNLMKRYLTYFVFIMKIHLGKITSFKEAA